MNNKSDELALIESALAAIQEVLARASEDQQPVPFHAVTMLAGLPDDERQALERIEVESYRARPEDSAVHFCLRSATALLDVSYSLLHQDDAQTPQQHEQHWKRLVVDTKTAGRAAYRAALILTDPRRATASGAAKS